MLFNQFALGVFVLKAVTCFFWYTLGRPNPDINVTCIPLSIFQLMTALVRRTKVKEPLQGSVFALLVFGRSRVCRWNSTASCLMNNHITINECACVIKFEYVACRHTSIKWHIGAIQEHKNNQCCNKNYREKVWNVSLNIKELHNGLTLQKCDEDVLQICFCLECKVHQ